MSCSGHRCESTYRRATERGARGLLAGPLRLLRGSVAASTPRTVESLSADGVVLRLARGPVGFGAESFRKSAMTGARFEARGDVPRYLVCTLRLA